MGQGRGLVSLSGRLGQGHLGREGAGRVLPFSGRRCTVGDSLLPLTLQSLCPRCHGAIGRRLVLSLLLALHALFFPPTRRPGGAGSKGESGGAGPPSPPWGACRPQPPPAPAWQLHTSSAPNPGAPAPPHSPVRHFCSTPSCLGWVPSCPILSLGPPWRRSLGMVGSKGNQLGVYRRVYGLCTRYGPIETQTCYSQTGACHPSESGNPW